MRGLKWAVIGLMSWGAVALADTPEQGVIVTGEGIVSVEPDMATIELGVTSTGETAAAAMQENAAAVARIIAELDTLGVAERDRQTSRFYLNPVWAHQQGEGDQRPRITGYEAGNSVSVRVRDLTGLGAVLDGVLKVGGNQFNGLSFGLQDDSAARAEARKAAVTDAMARSGQIAEAADLELGAVLRISEGAPAMPQPMMRDFAMAESVGNAIASGELEVRMLVTMVFDIAPQR